MEQDINKLKGLYVKRISLYENLLNCIKKERGHLLNQDVKGIWDSLDEKKEILEAIKENNMHFPGDYREVPVPNDAPRQDLDAIAGLKTKLGILKQDIGARTKENISFVNETLGFINDIFSVFTHSNSRPDTYGPNLKKKPESANLIYHNEV